MDFPKRNEVYLPLFACDTPDFVVVDDAARAEVAEYVDEGLTVEEPRVLGRKVVELPVAQLFRLGPLALRRFLEQTDSCLERGVTVLSCEIIEALRAGRLFAPDAIFAKGLQGSVQKFSLQRFVRKQ